MSILLQFVHPYPERSRVNRAILEAVAGLPDLIVNDLYANYPDFYIDIRREQALLADAGLVIFQHPFFWYGAPALLKEWIDVVLAHGFAYGPRGAALRGKAWLQSTTTGMPADTYGPGGFNEYSMEELLRPFQLTAQFCGMYWLEPTTFHDAHAANDALLQRYCAAFRRRLLAFRTHAELGSGTTGRE